MRDWLTYELSDLLLFSERVYWRLFELENVALWPMPLFPSLAMLGALILHARRPELGTRVILGLLAIAWLWTGWHFVWQRYAPINWAMTYFAPVFALEAFIFAGLALRRPQQWHIPVTARVMGYGLIFAATVAYPGLVFLQGRSFASAEIIAIAPDPTALASLGAAFFVAGRRHRAAAVAVPFIWLAQSTLTLFAMTGGAAIGPALGIAISAVGLFALALSSGGPRASLPR
ncbi:DUF6064 family protein [Roseovarius sp. S4756]|uniref:DUF6064 family protein n=1 Tax=Roseovarius maritimus TaxID=3342637 RepID=UPI00372C8FBF